MSTQAEKDSEYVAELIRCAALGDSQTVIAAAIAKRIGEAERRGAVKALDRAFDMLTSREEGFVPAMAVSTIRNAIDQGAEV